MSYTNEWQQKLSLLLTFMGRFLGEIQRPSLSIAEFLPERERVDAMGRVESTGRKRLDVVHVNVTDGETFSWRYVKTTPNSVHLHGTVDLTSLTECLGFQALFPEQHFVLALLEVIKIGVPLLFSVSIDNVLTSFTAAVKIKEIFI